MSADSLFERLSYPALGSVTPTDAYDRATARGFAAGYADGARQAAHEAAAEQARARAAAEQDAAAARAAVELALRALEAAAAQTVALARPVLADADAALAAAAVELAEIIIGTELDDHEGSARAAVTRALAAAGSDEVLTVRVHPLDLEVLGDAVDILGSARLVADPALDPGDAMAETPVGTIDARLGAAVDRARAILGGAA